MYNLNHNTCLVSSMDVKKEENGTKILKDVMH